MDDWRTPPEIFAPLHAEFHFDLDAAASPENALCERYLTDALGAEPWPGARVFVNPPYGNMLAPFVKRCAAEAKLGKIVVALIPMRTRAAWWHDWVVDEAEEVRCVRKRIKFLRPDGSRPEFSNNCDSAVVVWWRWKRSNGRAVLSSFRF